MPPNPAELHRTTRGGISSRSVRIRSFSLYRSGRSKLTLAAVNPFFAINSALVSRSRVFQFQPLSTEHIKTLLRRAIADPDRGRSVRAASPKRIAASMLAVGSPVSGGGDVAGRDPDSLQMIVRANLHITPQPLPEGRFIFSGSFEQVREDVAACARIGAHELVFDPTFTPGGQELATWNALMERLSAVSH